MSYLVCPTPDPFIQIWFCIFSSTKLHNTCEKLRILKIIKWQQLVFIKNHLSLETSTFLIGQTWFLLPACPAYGLTKIYKQPDPQHGNHDLPIGPHFTQHKNQNQKALTVVKGNISYQGTVWASMKTVQMAWGWEWPKIRVTGRRKQG